MEESNKTAYPSVERPWLKYYSEAAINAPLPMCSMYEYLWQNNQRGLGGIAMNYFGNQISYRKMFEDIDRAAASFRKLGVKKGDVVSFISITTPELVCCVYALNKLGAVANMLDPRSSEQTLITQIKRVQSSVLVILDACADKLESLNQALTPEHIIVLAVKESMGFPLRQLYALKTAREKKISGGTDWKEFLKTGAGASVSPVENCAHLPALIQYTGGTTGEPKGVLLSNLNINSVAEQYKNVALDYARQQSWLTVSAPFIAYSFICGLHLPLASGMVCCIELYDPEAMAKSVVKKRYNHVAVTPIVWENIIKNPDHQKKDLSFLISPTSGADYMSPKLEQEINDFFATHNCGWKICQGYGMTEVGSAVATNVSNECNKAGSVGIPFTHTLISAFDPDTDEELPMGQTGELCIQGPSVMLGYYKDPEATDKVIRLHRDGSRWMHTGDLGHLDEDGNVFIDGRIKRMITRYDGFKVFPAAVEAKLLTHPAIEKCSVVGRKDPRIESGQLPVAVLVLNDLQAHRGDAIIEEVKAICGQALPEYARPVDYHLRTSLPVTPAGKIDYRQLESEVIS